MKAMHRLDIRKVSAATLSKAGIVLQCLSAALIGVILLAIRLRWIDIVSIGLEGGIDTPSPKLEALYCGVRGLLLTFASGFAFYALAIHRQRTTGGQL
jgi:hypothetical protein